jgi:signal transduction histidine kinase
MEQQVLAVAVGCLAVAVVAVMALLIRQRRVSVRLRGRVAVLEGGQRIRDEELAHLVTARLPALAESLWGRPVEVPGPLHARLMDTPYGKHLEQVTQMVGEARDQAKTRAEESAKATLKSMMRGVQSLANEQQLEISRMQARHDDPDVLEGLLRIDHTNAQLGRRAQVSAVLCGSWPGLQRSASPLTDVVRGATSRIRDYLRVQVNSQVSDGVVSRAVEPVVLAVAELLDNAARHSQPNAPVEVNFRSSHNGMAIVIDDAGVAMNAEELVRAERLLSGKEEVEINRLGDPPQVGFAVIGVLAARYGFKVSVDTRSPYGGVRAVVFLPSTLLTGPKDKDKNKDAATGSAVPEPAPMEAPAESSGEARTAGGLPRRRRVSAAADPSHEPASAPVRPEPATYGEPAGPAPSAEPRPPSRKTAAGLGAWQRGTRSGRATVPPDSERKAQA